jgi:hypothetical protein
LFVDADDAAFAPEPVLVWMGNFTSDEYADLVGGELYEPHEENPMIGDRGASRYLSLAFAECFAMECAALRHVRDDMGLKNVKIMIPSSGPSSAARTRSRSCRPLTVRACDPAGSGRRGRVVYGGRLRTVRGAGWSNGWGAGCARS